MLKCALQQLPGPKPGKSVKGPKKHWSRPVGIIGALLYLNLEYFIQKLKTFD